MFLSIFDIFKVGVGPSSSHTMGPMVAASRFLAALKDGSDRIPGSGTLAGLKASLHGSLAFTGKGHATDRAVILGLAGFTPADFDPERAAQIEAEIHTNHQITTPDLGTLTFNPDTDLIYDYDRTLDGHANGMVLSAYDAAGALYMTETYYSVGGGFVLTERELTQQADDMPPPDTPHPFRTAADMLEMAKTSGLTIAEMKRANELSQGTQTRARHRHHPNMDGHERLHRSRTGH